MNIKSYIVVSSAVTAAGLLLQSAQSHADTPPDRYTTTADTVYDNSTQLTWQRTFATGRDWNSASSYCASLALNGTGWRLPSMKELQTIVDETREHPAIDIVAFSDLPAIPNFWTSSKSLDVPDKAWMVEFAFGSSDRDDTTVSGLVRCVR